MMKMEQIIHIYKYIGIVLFASLWVGLGIHLDIHVCS